MFLGYDLLAVLQQIFQQFKLLLRQLQLVPANRRFLGPRVERKPLVSQPALLIQRSVPAQERPYPGEQLRYLKRFSHVIIGSGIQSLDHILHTVPRGENQDRRPHPFGPASAHDLQPVHAGQHHIQHQQVINILLGHITSLLAAAGRIHLISFFFKQRFERLKQIGIVFHDEYFHRFSSRSFAKPSMNSV
ncbi:hypothetical protein D3C76_986020 [compost metagenome]